MKKEKAKMATKPLSVPAVTIYHRRVNINDGQQTNKLEEVFPVVQRSVFRMNSHHDLVVTEKADEFIIVGDDMELEEFRIAITSENRANRYAILAHAISIKLLGNKEVFAYLFHAVGTKNCSNA